MLGLFKSRKPAQAEQALPLSVESALCGLSVLPRPDSEGNMRVLLQWANDAGTCSWYHTPEETRRRLAQAFTSLNAAQLDLALRAVGGLVRAAQQDDRPPARRSSWASWAPMRSPEDLPRPY